MPKSRPTEKSLCEIFKFIKIAPIGLKKTYPMTKIQILIYTF